MASENKNASEDSNIKSKESIENIKTIPPDHLIELYKAGFRKLIPLMVDSKRANVYDHLITEDEIRAFPSSEGKPVRIIYQNPTFWTESRLKEKSHLFFNIATTFGITDLKDKGKPLYLYGVDVDSRQAYEALKDLIDVLKGTTFVVKSHKEYGYHFYILTPVLHDPLGPANFKLGAEMEVKTDMSLGTMHLPPSRHRSYPYWNYNRVSTCDRIYIDEDDNVFQQIVKAMSENLRKEPTEENILTLDAYASPSSSSGVQSSAPQQQPQRQRPNKILRPELIDKAVETIINHSKSYVKHSRNDFVYGLSGHLFHNGISELSTTSLVGKLCKAVNDEDAADRLDVVTETYRKGKSGKLVKGISQLKYILAKYNEENEGHVNEIISELNQVLDIGVDSNTSSSANISNPNQPGLEPPLTKEDPIAKAMVEIAESNGDVCIKNAFGEPYAIINSGGHIEVTSMVSKKFVYHLRTLLKRNKDRRIISSDSVEKAIETLKADAIVEGRTIPLHLRVAWKKKNQVIYYDRTDENWSCISIERDTGTWRLLPAGSLTSYPMSELRNPNSKLAEQPVLFTRYGQIPQVLPDRDYQQDIMQQFIDKCTNIKDLKDQLLLKAYIISLFIPEISHPILLLKGVKGAAKSMLETEVKRIIDPSQIELLILNEKRNDFIINLAHNYYNAYDNVRKIPQWLSNDICAATTGAAFSTRTLYTTADETYFKFRRCFALSSIGASLTEDDALERCISIRHPKLIKLNRKLEEKILAEFDSILPKLLGHIFDIVAKTMQLKNQLDQSGELEGKLERMADFSFWGEAAARAMGYKPLEFLNAYGENLKNQSRDAVNFNALAEIICTICQEEFITINTVEYTLPQLLAKVRQKASEMGIESTKFAWAKTPQSLSEEIMHLSTLIEDSYGYKIERYKDAIGRNGRRKNNSVIKITDLSRELNIQKNDAVGMEQE